MRAGRLRLPAVAAAAALPTLLAGLIAAPSPLLGLGPDDSMVRTRLVPPPAAATTDSTAPLDGAHPATDPLAGLALAAGHGPAPVDTGSRGVPVRVSGAALPARVLLAYRDAEATLHRSDPGCHLQWSLLAGIGQVESGQARGGSVDPQGRTLAPILGPVLDGTAGTAAIPDTDGGRLDGDPVWDRAVGPMQFIPSTWAVWGQDGDGNGTADPSDVDDASLAAGTYLCASGRDLRNLKDRRSAVFSYNHSWDYVDLVLAWADSFASGRPVVTPLVAAAGSTAKAARGGPSGAAIAPVSAAGPAGPVAGAAPVAPAGPAAGPAADSPAASSPAAAGPAADAASPVAAPPSAAPLDVSTAPPTVPPVVTATACPTPAPTVTSPPTPTPTGTPVPTDSATATPTDTATPTASPTDVPTGTATPDPSATATPDPSPTACPAP